MCATLTLSVLIPSVPSALWGRWVFGQERPLTPSPAPAKRGAVQCLCRLPWRGAALTPCAPIPGALLAGAGVSALHLPQESPGPNEAPQHSSGAFMGALLKESRSVPLSPTHAAKGRLEAAFKGRQEGLKAGHTLAQLTSCLLSGNFKSRPSLCRDLSLSCNSCPWQESFPDTVGRAVPSLCSTSVHYSEKFSAISAPCPRECIWRGLSGAGGASAEALGSRGPD